MQCGICIPGMILAAKALVDEQPGDPRTRCGRAWPATSAAARATPRSSPRSRARPPRPGSPSRAASWSRPPPRATSGRARWRRPWRSWPRARTRCGRWPEAPTSWSGEGRPGEPRRPLRPHRRPRDQGHPGAASGHLWIGAATTHTEMMRSAVVASRGARAARGLRGHRGPADPQSRDARREPGQRLARRGHRPAALRRGRDRRGGLGLRAPRHPHHGVLPRAAPEPARARRAHPRRARAQRAGVRGDVPAPGPAAGPGHLEGLDRGGHHLPGRAAGLGARGPGRGRRPPS